MRDLTGEKFHRLTVIGFSHCFPEKGKKGKGKRYYWKCVCDCGKEKIVRSDRLISGHTKSCGCYKTEEFKKRMITAFVTHGMTIGKSKGKKTPKIYKIWASMRNRCNYIHGGSYERYGGSGIKVCKKWDKSFEAFFEDMKDTYFEGAQIDRINNKKGYSKTNCRWVTLIEQANNKSNNRFITFDKQTHTVAEWSRIIGISPATILARLNKSNWETKDVLSPTLFKNQFSKLSVLKKQL